MPPQSLLRIVKRWRRYEERGEWRIVSSVARGVYVLYLLKRGQYRVVYIGVAGLNKIQKTASPRASEAIIKSVKIGLTTLSSRFTTTFRTTGSGSGVKSLQAVEKLTAAKKVDPGFFVIW